MNLGQRSISLQIYSHDYYFSITPYTFHPMGTKLRNINMKTWCLLVHSFSSVEEIHMSLADDGLRAKSGHSLIPYCS